MGKPTFLYIGAAKSGSSWLFEALRQHPEVFVPVAKDLMFFDLFYGRGAGWYSSFFPEGGAYKACGELTHDYFLDGETARRIQAIVPEVKLLCCLRNPAEVLVSMYGYNRTTTFKYAAPGRPAQALDFPAFLALEEVRRLVRYYENLAPFFELFPRDQILVLFYDDLRKDGTAFLERVFRFIGVSPEFRPDSLDTRVNAAREARIRFAAILAYKAGLLVRSMGGANLVGWVKRNPLFNRLLYAGASEETPIPLEAKRQLFEEFRGTFGPLEGLLGTPVPCGWTDPSEGGSE